MQKTTKRLRALLEMLPRKGSYAALTPTVKRHWTNLLTYNEHDCRGMKELVMRATRDLGLGMAVVPGGGRRRRMSA